MFRCAVATGAKKWAKKSPNVNFAQISTCRNLLAKKRGFHGANRGYIAPMTTQTHIAIPARTLSGAFGLRGLLLLSNL